MKRLLAPAKINLALVVGPRRSDGKHEIATVLQKIALADTITLERAETMSVEGFPDTLVRSALEALAREAGVAPRWAVTIEKQIPVSAGLGGGSSDAAAALHLANETLERPLGDQQLHALAGRLGADIPFFLGEGPQLGEGDGTQLSPLDLPQDYWVLLVLPDGARKESTAAVYESFSGHDGCERRRAALADGLARGDLAALPRNDLASSPLAEELRELGAFRADVTGAGPVVYGLFEDEAAAVTAASRAQERGEVWVTTPAW